LRGCFSRLTGLNFYFVALDGVSRAVIPKLAQESVYPVPYSAEHNKPVNVVYGFVGKRETI
jgi:hypothetical protein